MAHLFSDSFDMYASQADLGLRWSNVGNISLVAPGPYGVGQSASFGFAPTLKIWGSNEPTIYGTIRVNSTTSGTGGSSGSPYGGFITFGDLNSPQISLLFTGLGLLELRTGSTSGALIWTSAPGVFHQNAWDSWQFALTIGTTTGSFALYKNGLATAVVSLTAINTQGGSANVYVNSLLVGLIEYSNSDHMQVDDLLLCSATGAAPNTLPPDLRAVQLLPDGDVAVAWSLSAGTQHFALVNEPTEDGDATYVYSNTVGQEDRYAVAGLPVTITSVYGINPFAFWRKTDAGARTVAVQLLGNGTEIQVTSDTPGQTYVWSPEAFQKNDPTGVAWTPITVGTAQVGVKITA